MPSQPSLANAWWKSAGKVWDASRSAQYESGKRAQIFETASRTVRCVGVRSGSWSCKYSAARAWVERAVMVGAERLGRGSRDRMQNVLMVCLKPYLKRSVWEQSFHTIGLGMKQHTVLRPRRTRLRLAGSMTSYEPLTARVTAADSLKSHLDLWHEASPKTLSYESVSPSCQFCVCGGAELENPEDVLG